MTRYKKYPVLQKFIRMRVLKELALLCKVVVNREIVKWYFSFTARYF